MTSQERLSKITIISNLALSNKNQNKDSYFKLDLILLHLLLANVTNNERCLAVCGNARNRVRLGSKNSDKLSLSIRQHRGGGGLPGNSGACALELVGTIWCWFNPSEPVWEMCQRVGPMWIRMQSLNPNNLIKNTMSVYFC